jgi:photosynthesis system II assembly factor YCF48-like protein
MERRRERGKGGRRDRKLERWRPLCLFVSLSLCLSASLSLRLPTSGQRLEWGAQSSGALSKLSGVFFVDRDHGWIVGSNGTLLATVDGGAKWLRRTLPERQRSEALNDVWFFNPDRGLLLGEYGLFNRKGGR